MKNCPPYISDYHRTYFLIKGQYVKIKTTKTDRMKLNWWHKAHAFYNSYKYKQEHKAKRIKLQLQIEWLKSLESK